MGRVIVFGSINMDIVIQCKRLPKVGETIAGDKFFTNAGGKGGNQAVAAAKLGAETQMIACVGNDAFGGELSETLKSYGVQCHTVYCSKAQKTGVAVITCCNGDNRIILSHGANYELKAEEVTKLITQSGTKGDVFVTQFECDKEAVLQSLVTAKLMGMFTIFNPAPAREISPEFYKSIDLIVVNMTECQFLTGITPDSKEQCLQAMKCFQDMGAGQVIITLGAEGSVYSDGEEIHAAQQYRGKVVDTTAAGDTYIGALAAGISKGWEIKECISYAAKAATLTIMKYGAQQSIPLEAEVMEYFKGETNE